MSASGNLVIAQGGGPTAVINASLVGAVHRAHQLLSPHSRIWGARQGILGVLHDQYMDLRTPGPSAWEAVAYSPGAALGSCRKMLNEEEAQAAVQALRAREVRYFFYIGGNDSMDTALKMCRAARQIGYELACAGIPKTIDNDLPATDHCPGFGSAARYIAQAARDLGMDVGSLPTPVSILEVMGRNAGWLTAATLLARQNEGDAPHLIYVPERPLTRRGFLDAVQSTVDRQGWVVVAVSEGAVDEQGKSWSERRSHVMRDDFGHPLPGDVASTLADMVSSELGLRARSEKPGLLGRASIALLSPTDHAEAQAAGAFGVEWALAGHSGFMVAIRRLAQTGYEIAYEAVPLDAVANQTRVLPSEYLAEDGLGIRESYRDYVAPLIGGPLMSYARLAASTAEA